MTSTRATILRTVFLLAGTAFVAVPTIAAAQTPAPQPAAPGTVPPGAAPAVTAQPPEAVPSTEKPVTPPAPKTWKDLLVLEGLVDSYYLYNLGGHNSTTPAQGIRQFDVNSNSFTLNYAKLAFGVTPEPVGLRIDLGYGTTGQIINTAIPAEATVLGSASTPALAVSPFLVQQAFATVALPLKVPVLVDFGKFVTSAGAEVIEANKNWNYSRSFLFFNAPLVHNGLRITAKPTPELTLQASVVNGWNGTGYLPDTTKDKTFGFYAAYAAPTKTTFAALTYFGYNESTAATTNSGFRIFGELIVTQEVGDKFAFYLDTEYIDDRNSLANGGVYDNFWGAALAGRYIVAPHLTVAARGEFARNGTATLASNTSKKIGTATLTIGVPVDNRFEFRAEARGDFADADAFNPNAAGVPTDKNQGTVLGAFLAWF